MLYEDVRNIYIYIYIYIFFSQAKRVNYYKLAQNMNMKVWIFSIFRALIRCKYISKDEEK